MQTDSQTPPILPQSESGLIPEPASPVTAPANQSSRKPTKRAIIIAAIVIILVISVVGALSLSGGSSSGPGNQLTPTPTASPSADSTRPLSAIATESAFLEFEKASDELVRGIQNAPIQNQELLPPRLDLPLGF